MKTTRKVTQTVCMCERCGHEWVPELPDPNICPKCKSKFWNVKPDKEKIGA